jgi:hypothetical protein
MSKATEIQEQAFLALLIRKRVLLHTLVDLVSSSSTPEYRKRLYRELIALAGLEDQMSVRIFVDVFERQALIIRQYRKHWEGLLETGR